MRTTLLIRAFAASIALVGAVASLAALGGCWSDDRPIQWERQRTVLGPIPLKTQVAYVDSALDRVVMVDVADAAPVISHTRIGRRALYAVPSARQAFVSQRHPQGRMSFIALDTGAIRTVTGFDLNSQIVDH